MQISRRDGVELLEKKGALLGIRVGTPEQPGWHDVYPPPEPIHVLAKVDTGTWPSAISRRIVDERLGLKPVNSLKANTVSHQDVIFPIYLVSLWVGSTLLRSVCHVVAHDGSEAECLIGRDLLRDGRFEYDAGDGAYNLRLQEVTTVEYPLWLM